MNNNQDLFAEVVFNVPFKRFDKSSPTLFKEDEGNAGFDLFARLDENVIIYPGDTAFIPLNLATDLPVGIVGLLFQRSSTYKKWGIRLTNNVGVIDSSYCGDGDEWLGQFKNETDAPIVIKNGDKICQALFFQLAPINFVEQERLGNINRGGYGTSFNNAEEIKK